MTGSGRENKGSRGNNAYVYIGNMGMHPLKQVFDMYIEEEISDEQTRRVLEPVLKMINEGAFSRPRSTFFLAKSTLSLFAVAIIAAVVAGI